MFEDDVTKYRKKKQRRPPKKSDHRHEYQSCILRASINEFDKAHGKVPVYRLVKAFYCPMCGKIKDCDVVSLITRVGITEEEMLTLPIFTVKDLFLTKFVDLKEKQKNAKFLY